MVCKMNEIMSTTVYPERQETIALTKTPVSCPVCEKQWTHSWCSTFIVDGLPDGFCSEECRKMEVPENMCGHYLCNISGPAVTEMIPNPYHPKNQKLGAVL